MDEGAVTLGGLPYPVCLTDDASGFIARTLAGRGARRAVLFFDRRASDAADRIRSALDAARVEVAGAFALRGGEKLKRIRESQALYENLLTARADRRTHVVAIGGGTITDSVGFAAATYMRGLPWVAVPTTILGMVDAAIGGKTAVDLTEGKNLAGAFWDPVAVAADLNSLATLAARQRRTGIAEIIKAAIVGDAALFEAVEDLSARARLARWTELIAAAARVKIAIVAADPREHGSRAALNLGHTFGHAFEYASGFRMAHGDAVAVGLRGEGLLALARGWWSHELQGRLVRALDRFGLPLFAESLSADAILEGMRRDKKRVDGALRFALPTALGSVKVGVEVSEAEVEPALRACMAPPSAAEMSA